MHGAPSVSYPVGRSRFMAGFVAGTVAAAAAGVAAWAVQVNPSGPRLLAACCTFLAAGAFALRGWRGGEPGSLAWSGDAWTWSRGEESEAGSPQAVVDLQSVMLLRWCGDGGGVRWLCAERRARPSSWMDLRRAVYSRARPGGPARRDRGAATT